MRCDAAVTHAWQCDVQLLVAQACQLCDSVAEHVSCSSPSALERARCSTCALTIEHKHFQRSSTATIWHRCQMFFSQFPAQLRQGMQVVQMECNAHGMTADSCTTTRQQSSGRAKTWACQSLLCTATMAVVPMTRDLLPHRRSHSGACLGFSGCTAGHDTTIRM